MNEMTQAKATAQTARGCRNGLEAGLVPELITVLCSYMAA